MSELDRMILAVGGADRYDFLQGLVTNDVTRTRDGLVYAALLTPQGKYLADFFLLARGEEIWIDVARSLGPSLLKRLTMYKLRASVEIAPRNVWVIRGTGQAPEGALPDPRDSRMGWRLYSETEIPTPDVDWQAVRVDAVVPETGIELRADETYILEAGFERLNGVDFRKGCYVGQEVTARMKHKATLRKGLDRVEIDGAADIGSEILADGKVVGTLFTQSGGRALAHLRFDHAKGDMQAGTATLRRE